MKRLLLSFCFLTATMLLVAQAPESFKYQAVARDGSGNVLANHQVSFRISIIQGTVTGDIVYSERHNTVTNEFGLVNLEIGRGAVATGTMAGINWGVDAHFIMIEMDPDAGTSYQLMGTSQLLSVPYALYAKKVATGDNWGTQTVAAGNAMTGNGTLERPLQVANEGITSVQLAGSAVIPDKLASGAVTGEKIAQSGATSGQALKWNGTTWAPADDAIGGPPFSLPYSGIVASANPAFSVTNNGTGDGIRAVAFSASETGIIGEAPNQGILGSSTSRSGAAYGVQGTSISTSGSGVTGYASAVTGSTFGLRGLTASNAGTGVYANSSAGSGTTYGIYSEVASPDGFSGYFKGGKFYADAPFGIGTLTPTRTLTVHGGAGVSALSLINDATGSTSVDGLFVGISGSTNYIWGYENYPLTLGTNNTVRMYLTADGDVGIGTNVPAAKFQVAVNSTTTVPHILLSESDDEYARLMFKNSVSTSKNWTIAGAPWSTDAGARLNFYYYNGTAGSDVVSITGDGKVGIGTNTPTQALHVIGNAYKTVGGTSWATSSDIRLKNLLGDYEKGLDEITALQPVRYTYMENNPRQLTPGEEQVGFVAQEVEKVFPEAVTRGSDGYLDFNIHSINIAMVNAVKQLKAENDRLKAEMKKLADRLDRVEKR